MSTGAYTGAGTDVQISLSTPVTEDAAGFGALTYTRIAAVSEIGEYGPENDEVTFEPMFEAVEEKLPGLQRSGTVAIQAAFLPDDPGHVLASTARNNRQLAAVVVIYPSGTKDYFTAYVTSYKRNPGSANNVVMATINLSVSSDVITV